MNAILDAGPMVAFLGGEEGGDVVRGLLADPTTTCYCHAVSIIEVYYHFLRISDEETAEKVIGDLLNDGLIIREDMDPLFWRMVSRLKIRGRISLADCFCIALAQRVGGNLYTTDHHEFDALVPLDLCTIVFIR